MKKTNFLTELGATFMSFVIVLTLCLGFSTVTKANMDQPANMPQHTIVASVE